MLHIFLNVTEQNRGFVQQILGISHKLTFCPSTLQENENETSLNDHRKLNLGSRRISAIPSVDQAMN